MASRARKCLLICTLLATFTYPLSERLARNGGVEAEVKIEQCEGTLKVTERYSALGHQLGDVETRTFPLEAWHATPPGADPSGQPIQP